MIQSPGILIAPDIGAGEGADETVLTGSIAIQLSVTLDILGGDSNALVVEQAHIAVSIQGHSLDVGVLDAAVAGLLVVLLSVVDKDHGGSQTVIHHSVDLAISQSTVLVGVQSVDSRLHVVGGTVIDLSLPAGSPLLNHDSHAVLGNIDTGVISQGLIHVQGVAGHGQDIGIVEIVVDQGDIVAVLLGQSIEDSDFLNVIAGRSEGNRIHALDVVLGIIGNLVPGTLGHTRHSVQRIALLGEGDFLAVHNSVNSPGVLVSGLVISLAGDLAGGEHQVVGNSAVLANDHGSNDVAGLGLIQGVHAAGTDAVSSILGSIGAQLGIQSSSANGLDAGVLDAGGDRVNAVDDSDLVRIALDSLGLSNQVHGLGVAVSILGARGANLQGDVLLIDGLPVDIVPILSDGSGGAVSTINGGQGVDAILIVMTIDSKHPAQKATVIPANTDPKKQNNFFYGNADTTYITVNVDEMGGDVVIDDVDNVTTGIKNVSIDVYSIAKAKKEAKASSATNVSHGIYTVYDGGYAVASIVIGDDGATSDKFAFLYGAAKKESYNKSEKLYTWVMDAIVGGEKTTITFKSELPSTMTDAAEAGDLYKVSYNKDGYATEATPAQYDSDYVWVDDYAKDPTKKDIVKTTFGTSSQPKVDLTADGDTLWITEQGNNRGIVLADNCPAVIVEQKTSSGNEVDKVVEYASVAKAIKALDNYDSKTDGVKNFDGTIIVMLKDGIATSVILTDTVEKVDHKKEDTVAGVTASLKTSADGKGLTLHVTGMTTETVTYKVIATDIRSQNSAVVKTGDIKAEYTKVVDVTDSTMSYAVEVTVDGKTMTVSL